MRLIRAFEDFSENKKSLSRKKHDVWFGMASRVHLLSCGSGVYPARLLGPSVSVFNPTFPTGYNWSILLGKSLQMVTAAMKVKDTCSLEEKL